MYHSTGGLHLSTEEFLKNFSIQGFRTQAEGEGAHHVSRAPSTPKSLRAIEFPVIAIGASSERVIPNPNSN